MQRYLGGYEGIGFALLRVVLAFLYWSHGPKWLFGWFGGRPPIADMTRFQVAGTLEIVCGILIAVGLFTSWAAFIASGEMAVACYIAHVPRGSWLPIMNGGEITVAGGGGATTTGTNTTETGTTETDSTDSSGSGGYGN